MAERRLPLDWRVYRAAALIFLAIKLALLLAARPFMDETYYWLWGQHLALSYFDHPPMIGWTQWAASLFGWNIAGLRIMVFATLVGDLLLLAGLARHLDSAMPRETFWVSAAIFLAAPVGFGLTNLALPDHLLIFFSLLTVFALARFRMGFEAGLPRWRWLYLAAFAVGAATLTKYTGAILAAAFVLLIVLVPRLRPLWRSPHLYLAMLLAAAMQAPVVVWNLQHDLASFGFITGGRQALPAFSLDGLTGYLAGILLVLSPFLIWPAARFLVTRGDGNTYPRLVFWISTLAFLAASAFTNILIHWNAIAYVAVIGFLHPWVRSRIVAFGHFVFGGLLAAILAVNYAVIPVQSLLSFTDHTTAWSYGWDEITTELRSVTSGEQDAFIAATDYGLASPLAFALADPAVASLTPRREAFDDWTDYPALAGKTAIILADRWRPLHEDVVRQFSEVAEARSFDVERFGKLMNSYTIYVARGYSPAP